MRRVLATDSLKESPITSGGFCISRKATARTSWAVADYSFSAGYVAVLDIALCKDIQRFERLLGAVSKNDYSFLFARFGIVNIKHPAQFSAVKSISVFHGSNFLVRASQTMSSDGCISYTKRTANCVSASGA